MYKWRQTRNGGVAPERGNGEDAGWDLITCESVKVEVGDWVNVPIGIAIELPDWSWGLIIGRSSTLAKRRLLVPPSVIDHGYRGELFVICQNVGREVAEIEKGSRVGQLITMLRCDAQGNSSVGGVIATWDECETLSESVRGEGGFGSTGR